jgi:hypothetical protein
MSIIGSKFHNAIDPRNLASALGGEVSGDQIRAPGPGHSKEDRSLSVKLDSGAPDGFVVHSFANASFSRAMKLGGSRQTSPSCQSYCGAERTV